MSGFLPNAQNTQNHTAFSSPQSCAPSYLLSFPQQTSPGPGREGRAVEVRNYSGFAPVLQGRAGKGHRSMTGFNRDRTWRARGDQTAVAAPPALTAQLRESRRGRASSPSGTAPARSAPAGVGRDRRAAGAGPVSGPLSRPLPAPSARPVNELGADGGAWTARSASTSCSRGGGGWGERRPGAAGTGSPDSLGEACRPYSEAGWEARGEEEMSSPGNLGHGRLGGVNSAGWVSPGVGC